MLQNIYLGLGFTVLSFYGLASSLGWELDTPGRESAQTAHTRHVSGGARSYWISGYRGGK